MIGVLANQIEGGVAPKVGFPPLFADRVLQVPLPIKMFILVLPTKPTDHHNFCWVKHPATSARRRDTEGIWRSHLPAKEACNTWPRRPRLVKVSRLQLRPFGTRPRTQSSKPVEQSILQTYERARIQRRHRAHSARLPVANFRGLKLGIPTLLKLLSHQNKKKWRGRGIRVVSSFLHTACLGLERRYYY